MTKLPQLATDLVRELDKSIPPKCIGADQPLTDAHRYAAQRELVDALLRRLDATLSIDPSKPLLAGNAS